MGGWGTLAPGPKSLSAPAALWVMLDPRKMVLGWLGYKDGTWLVCLTPSLLPLPPAAATPLLEGLGMNCDWEADSAGGKTELGGPRQPCKSR